MQPSAAVLQQLAQVRLLVLDVDGVLTDGGL
jgi:3-deoxy-D-manno-octulosonate 8-phosphate phosphatase KdsC-like HAD superfamily phosphatase